MIGEFQLATALKSQDCYRLLSSLLNESDPLDSDSQSVSVYSFTSSRYGQTYAYSCYFLFITSSHQKQ